MSFITSSILIIYEHTIESTDEIDYYDNKSDNDTDEDAIESADEVHCNDNKSDNDNTRVDNTINDRCTIV